MMQIEAKALPCVSEARFPIKTVVKRFSFIMVIILLSIISATRANAQASLLTEDIIDDIKVKPDNGDKKAYTVTVVRDAYQRDQWYYVPNAPRLVERDVNGKRFPEFALVKYQYDDPANPGQLLEGAILQFAVTLALPADEQTQIRSEIGKRANLKDVNPNAIRLSAMPIKSAEVVLYVPGANPGDPASFLKAVPNGTGIAPTFASQKMVFSVPLSRIGANMYDALTTTGGTGVPIAVTYKYNGTTPPAGFKVTAHYDQLYKHYSQNKEFAAKASWWGWVGTSFRSSSSSVYNELISNKDIDVELITGETFDMNKAQEYLSPILNQINQNLIEVMRPPVTVEPAKAQLGNGAGFFGSANYAVATKDETHRRHGDEVYSMKVRSIVERQTVASGFIGIQNYDKDIKNQVIVFAPHTFQNSAFLLPQIAFNDADDVSDVQYVINARGGSPERQLISKTATWTAKNGWFVDGRPANLINFGLGGYGLDLNQQKQSIFDTDVIVNFAGGNRSAYQYKQKINAFNGSIPVATPLNTVDTVEIDSSFIDWGKEYGLASQHTKLVGIQTKIISGSRQATAILKQQNNNGVISHPKNFFWLVGSSASGSSDPLNASLIFIFSNGARLPWRHNGSLRSSNLIPQVLLTDGDVPSI